MQTPVHPTRPALSGGKVKKHEGAASPGLAPSTSTRAAHGRPVTTRPRGLSESVRVRHLASASVSLRHRRRLLRCAALGRVPLRASSLPRLLPPSSSSSSFLLSLLVCCELPTHPIVLLLFTPLFSLLFLFLFPFPFPSYGFLPLLSDHATARPSFPFLSNLLQCSRTHLLFSPLTHPELQFELQTSLPAPGLQANTAWGVGGQDWPAGRVTG